MKKEKKTIILSSIILGVLVLTLGITYALFSYQETSNNTSQLIMGDIYMHYKENNQLILNNAMPQEGFKTLITGYKVNPIMATQDAEDTSTELYKCINLFQNEWEWELEEGEDFESFCKGTGTQNGWTLQMYLDDVFGEFGEDNYNTMLSLNIIQEETLEYTSIKLNPEIKNQTVEYENELTACVYFWDSIGINEALDEGSTTETFCQGTGTFGGGVTLQQFWDLVNQEDGFMEEIGNTLINNNIMVLENDLYVVNPNMANQTVEEINELMTCIGIFTREGYEFDDATTAESFCKGEGTYDGGITLKKEFEDNSDDIYYMRNLGNLLLENNIISANVDLPYFEFTISGKNTYSEKDIYYDIKLDYGDPHETRNTRLEDNFLKFRFVEVNPDKTKKIIFDNESYSSIENQKIHTEIIPKNTMNEINKTYRLYMWINEDVVIGNIDEDYTIEEWNDVFASVKVNVSGEIDNSVLLSTVFKDVLKNKPDTTIVDDDGTIYVSGARESGSIFIGDESTHELEIPDKYKVDYNYVWYSGKLWRITSVNPDGTMKLITENPITSINWGNSGDFETSYVREWLTQEFLPTLYNYENVIVTNYKWDITPDSNIPPTKSSNPILIESSVGLLTAYEYSKNYQALEKIDNEYVNEISEGSYLSIGAYYYLMTPSSKDSEMRCVEYKAYYGANIGDCGISYSTNPSKSSIRPAIVLKSTVLHSDGDGSYNNPYRIKEDQERAIFNTTLLNTRQSGEYVKIEDDLDEGRIFRIVDTELINGKHTTKLVLSNYVNDNSDIDGDSDTKEVLILKFSNLENINLWANLDKSDTTIWRGYLNNIWIKEIDKSYNVNDETSNILEKGIYYLGYLPERQSYKTTVCNEVNSDISVRQCIENNQIVDNIVYSDYVGFLRVGEMFSSHSVENLHNLASHSNDNVNWLITPKNFEEIYFSDMDGLLRSKNGFKSTMAARPTINLKSNLVIKSGDGTKNNPFIVGLPE